MRSLSLPGLKDCRGLEMHIFSLLTHTKHLISVIFCDKTAGIGATFRTHGMMNGRTNGRTDRRGS